MIDTVSPLRLTPSGEADLKLYYGGTFDPFHRGHLAIARAARDVMNCSVTLIPAADPPARPAPGASAGQRLHMIELAIASEHQLNVDECELQRARQLTGPSYTVDTLKALRLRLGQAVPIAWLLGADAFAQLMQWHRWQDIIQLAHLVVADRQITPAHQRLANTLASTLFTEQVTSADALRMAPFAKLMWLHQPMCSVSATHVRAEIAARTAQWASFVHPAVAQYIRQEKLYLPKTASRAADLG